MTYARKLVTEDNFPQHHRNSDHSAEDDNSPLSVFHYFKHCCLVEKSTEPWFHSVPNYYLHWELFNNSSQYDSSLLWVVKHTIGLPAYYYSWHRRFILSLSFIKYIFQGYFLLKWLQDSRLSGTQMVQGPATGYLPN